MAKTKKDPPKVLTPEERIAALEGRLTTAESRLARLDTVMVGFAKDYPNIHAGYFTEFLESEGVSVKQVEEEPVAEPDEDESEEGEEDPDEEEDDG
jgi:hypothetical protein